MTGSDSQASHQPVEGKQFGDGGASVTKTFKKKAISKAMGAPRSNFIRTANGQVSVDDVAAAIVVRAEKRKGLVLLDDRGEFSGWQDFDTLDEAVKELNSVVDQLGARSNVLHIQDHCFIPFSFIKALSARNSDRGQFLVIDGHKGRALSMFSTDDASALNELKELISRILLGEQANEMISFED